MYSGYGLTELPFRGSLYIWWNGRTENDSVFKRLDRIFGNEHFWLECNISEVQHLLKDGPNHAPLHVMCKSGIENIRKPFRFLNLWTKHHIFQEEVRKTWEQPVEGSLSGC